MKKISSIIEKKFPQDGLPVRGVNGYGGEQDGDFVLFSGPHWFGSREQADREFPNGVPEYVQLHWAKYRPGHGWECVFGWWASRASEGDGNQLIGE